jgi:N-acetylmuramoyl-L-alanine amidase
MSLRIVDAPSPNFNERQHPLDMLVLHYTGMKDGPSALARLCDPEAQVSAHYMVEEDGTVFAIVPEDKRAWHAGRSWWQGEDDLNSRSIGIEIVNGGHDFGLPPYPDVQIAAVIELCQAILARWPIHRTRIVAHSDIAPARKDDPGERFPWERLAKAGVGIWPTVQASAPDGPVLREGDDSAAVEALRDDLASMGYHILGQGAFDAELTTVVRAFQRRWRPESVTGEADTGTLARIASVAAQYR